MMNAPNTKKCICINIQWLENLWRHMKYFWLIL